MRGAGARNSAPPDDVSAVHLTLLKPDGSGKAEVEKPKLVIASPAGKPIVIAPLNDSLGLAICEGSRRMNVDQATGLGTRAAGSAGTMPHSPYPIAATSSIVADANEAGQSRSTKPLEGLAARGIQPRSCHRGDAAKSCDVNDTLREHGTEGLRQALDKAPRKGGESSGDSRRQQHERNTRHSDERSILPSPKQPFEVANVVLRESATHHTAC